MADSKVWMKEEWRFGLPIIALWILFTEFLCFLRFYLASFTVNTHANAKHVSGAYAGTLRI